MNVTQIIVNKITPKKGYLFRSLDEPYETSDCLYMSDVANFGSWEEIPDPDYVRVGDGTAFDPFIYEIGDYVEKGMWYTDNEYIWECIKTGTPTDFSDPEYFEIIN